MAALPSTAIALPTTDLAGCQCPKQVAACQYRGCVHQYRQIISLAVKLPAALAFVAGMMDQDMVKAYSHFQSVSCSCLQTLDVGASWVSGEPGDVADLHDVESEPEDFEHPEDYVHFFSSRSQ